MTTFRLNRIKCDGNINLVLNLDMIFSHHFFQILFTLGITNEDIQITQYYFGNTFLKYL